MDYVTVEQMVKEAKENAYKFYPKKIDPFTEETAVPVVMSRRDFGL